MAVLFIVIIGTSIFCFYQGYIGTGIICLIGFSKTIGFLALIYTSIYLFFKGHYVMGFAPIGLIAWNIIGMYWTERDRHRAEE